MFKNIEGKILSLIWFNFYWQVKFDFIDNVNKKRELVRVKRDLVYQNGVLWLTYITLSLKHVVCWRSNID